MDPYNFDLIALLFPKKSIVVVFACISSFFSLRCVIKPLKSSFLFVLTLFPCEKLIRYLYKKYVHLFEALRASQQFFSHFGGGGFLCLTSTK